MKPAQAQGGRELMDEVDPTMPPCRSTTAGPFTPIATFRPQSRQLSAVPVRAAQLKSFARALASS